MGLPRALQVAGLAAAAVALQSDRAGADLGGWRPAAPAAVASQPFGGGENEAELTRRSAKAQDALVDAIENAEFVQIKRAAFRALARLRDAQVKELDTVAPRQEFKMLIRKTTGQMLGLSQTLQDGSSLKITEVSSGGLVQQWNDNHPELAVKPGDSIVEVNGIRNDQQMLDECRQDKTLELVVKRGQEHQGVGQRSARRQHGEAAA